MPSSREPMSASDLAWLRMERATNPMTIVGVLTFKERLKYPALRRLLEQRLLRFKRFRQRPVHDALGSYWQEDENFQLEHHLCRLSLAPRARQRHLEAAAGELAGLQLNPCYPLWQFHCVERYGSGSALVARFHHCYADGMALLGVFASLTDRTRQDAHAAGEFPQAGASQTPESSFTSAATAAATLVQNLGQGALDLLSTSLHALAHPQQTLAATRQLTAAGSELAALSLLSDDPVTPLKRPLGTRKHVAWAEPLPLGEIKTIAAALGCTINDVLLSCVAGALGSHLASCGEVDVASTVRALVPVNLRTVDTDDTLGNHFGLVFLELPVGNRNPLSRLYAVHEHMAQLKHSTQALASLWLLTALGSLPEAVEQRSVDVFTSKASLVISNVPGSREPLYFAGARIDEQYFWVPQAGSIGLGISLFSYAGRMHCGVMSDHNVLAEPHSLAEGLRTEFERLLLSVIAGPLAAAELPARHEQNRDSH